jgi:hypothetical protein
MAQQEAMDIAWGEPAELYLLGTEAFLVRFYPR